MNALRALRCDYARQDADVFCMFCCLISKDEVM